MDFQKSIEFHGPLDEVFTLFCDQGFREQVASEAGAESWEIDLKPGPNGGTTATMITRRNADELPAAARRIIGKQLTINQVEKWTSTEGGTLEVTIPGAPGHIKGTINLTEQDGITVQTVTADIKVRVPLVGKQFEKLIGQILGNILKLQGRVANETLSGS
ncbi:MAG TPA: DUF2505 domain-containing protein [Marmoricola sp.]|nr:DUF2505 domain-containing protein [Marmoricola sp.]